MGYCRSYADYDIEIVISDDDNPGPRPKAPSTIPITATLVESINAVVLFFREDLGAVHIEIENVSGGEYVEAEGNASIPYMFILFSGLSGYYQLRIQTANGPEYSGFFVL